MFYQLKVILVVLKKLFCLTVEISVLTMAFTFQLNSWECLPSLAFRKTRNATIACNNLLEHRLSDGRAFYTCIPPPWHAVTFSHINYRKDSVRYYKYSYSNLIPFPLDNIEVGRRFRTKATVGRHFRGLSFQLLGVTRASGYPISMRPKTLFLSGFARAAMECLVTVRPDIRYKSVFEERTKLPARVANTR